MSFSPSNSPPRSSTHSELPTQASEADQYRIYQLAVQSPEADIELLQHIFKASRGRKGYRLREDFCGTGLTLSHWINQGSRYRGEGFDYDPAPVQWGLQHNFAVLGKAASRATLHIADARSPSLHRPDIRCAFNFSYWVFLEQKEMLEYFSNVYADLADDGVFIIDATGGTESLSEEPYESDHGDFSCIWHQENFSPIDHSADLTLRFRFSDGSELEPPYRYRWRVWSIPELTDLLLQAGFTTTNIWWQNDDAGDIGFEITRKGYNDPCWVACIAALK